MASGETGGSFSKVKVRLSRSVMGVMMEVMWSRVSATVERLAKEREKTN